MYNVYISLHEIILAVLNLLIKMSLYYCNFRYFQRPSHQEAGPRTPGTHMHNSSAVTVHQDRRRLNEHLQEFTPMLNPQIEVGITGNSTSSPLHTVLV